MPTACVLLAHRWHAFAPSRPRHSALNAVIVYLASSLRIAAVLGMAKPGDILENVENLFKKKFSANQFSKKIKK